MKPRREPVADLVSLLKKEFSLELRQKTTLSAVGLYLVCLVFICYLTFSLKHDVVKGATWSALFWLTVLFSVINSIAKSFIGEKKGLGIYYYYLASPYSIILAKIIYNTIFAFILSVIGFVLFCLFIGNPISDHLLFLATLILSSQGFAASLSLISSIAAKGKNSNILMAVLSFPVVISILLMSIRITKNVLDDLDRSVSYDELLNLLAINCILTALAYILFPYIWRS